MPYTTPQPEQRPRPTTTPAPLPPTPLPTPQVSELEAPLSTSNAVQQRAARRAAATADIPATTNATATARGRRSGNARPQGTSAPAEGEIGTPAASPSGEARAGTQARRPRDRAARPERGTTDQAEETRAGTGEAASTDAGSAAGAAGGPALLMPEPPTQMSAAARERIETVRRAVEETAEAHGDLPPASEQVGQARGAVTPPPVQTEAEVAGELVAELGARPEPSPEIEELCQHIYTVIREKRPADEKSLVRAEPEQMARAAGGELNQTVQGDIQRVQGGYQDLQGQPEAQPAPPGLPIVAPPQTVDTPAVDAGAATPDPVPAESVSLAADVAANQARLREAGMDTEAARLVQSGPVAEARAAQGELEGLAQRGPADVLIEQQAALAQSRADMANLQRNALTALQASRRGTITGASERQQGMVGSEQQQRARAGEEARTLFQAAQSQVRTTLQGLTTAAMSKWENGVKVLAITFKAKLKRVEDWLKERHGGDWGGVVKFIDDVTGYPAWVTVEYDQAERDFGDGVCRLVREIAADVNRVVAACEAIITDTDRRIRAIFANLGPGLQEWASGQQAHFREQLAGLRTEARQARDNFTRDLIQRAEQSVQDVRVQIQALRTQARGILGRTIDALNRFLDDPARALLEGLLELVGIPPADFWSLVDRIQHVIQDIAADPLNFANNLLAAVGQGFSLFFDHAGEHLLQGLLDWLFSGLKDVGVELPRDLSLKSIVTFFLQLMGITWARIRRLLARHIGEENVALIEKAWSVISTLIEQGPEGLFEMIKDRLNPQSLIDMVLQSARDFLVETLIKQVSVRILALFNPAGAIFQALEAVYRVLKWVFNNAARIFRLVETVVNGAQDIVRGNIGGMASAIETALASLIGPVIDFLADYIGAGNLPGEIARTIGNFQQWVEGILDQVIGWLAEQGRALLRALGVGGEPAEGEGEYDGEIGKVVTFTAGDERHQLSIEVERESAQVVMASVKKPVTVHLDEYAAKLDSIEVSAQTLPNGAAARTNALTAIQSARGIVSQIDELLNRQKQIPRNERGAGREIKEIDRSIETKEDALKLSIMAILVALRLDAPTGKTSKIEDAIPMIWFKPMGLYRRIVLNGEPYFINDHDTVTVPPESGLADVRRHAASDDVLEIGVSSQYFPEVGKILRRVRAGVLREGTKQSNFRTLLRRLGFDWGTAEADHVQDIQWGGPDDYSNLWPLERRWNNAANQILDQDVTYKTADGDIVTVPLRDTPLELRFRIVETRTP